MNVIAQEGSAPIKMWTDHVGEPEESALQQLRDCASMPFIYKHIAVMPDVHTGMGATVGSVIPTKGAVIPAAVGVDIGCGMQAVRTNLTADALPDDLSSLRSAIEAAVPHGRSANGAFGKDKGSWVNEVSAEALSGFYNTGLRHDYERLVESLPGIKHPGVVAQLGTLGTGNHFIELCLDESDNVWIMLHSGSRGIGNKIGSYFIDQASKLTAKWFVNLPNKNLGYLPQGTDAFNDYLKAVNWAQKYARTNRDVMMTAVQSVLMQRFAWMRFSDRVDCHHNYLSTENHFGENVLVTRKGAVSARKDQLAIIPGSMGARSFIVKGLGNPQSFCSCSHGAGRRMSRTEARKTFTLQDHRQATEGVECRKDEGVIDETPAAYKDIDAVMASQADLVQVVHTLKQVVCVKG